MLPRHKSEEIRKKSEEIYRMRMQGRGFKDIARKMEMGYQDAVQRHKRECIFREQAFYYPFIEYITTRTEKAVRRSLGEHLLATPEKLSDPGAIRVLFCWPGVGEGVLKDLAGGLAEAGYDTFDTKNVQV